MKNNNPNEIPKLIAEGKSRIELARQSHIWFFYIYFSHYTTYSTAEFQRRFFALSEDESLNPLAIMAFRGSAKSTIFTMSFPIWAILGKLMKKYIILVGLTMRQAKQHLINIKRELEGNELLKADLGPFQEQEDEWGSYSLVLPWFNARITAASMEQTIRGMRHKQYRPDLIICDDIEDLASVKTKEGRDKVFDWITSEIIPAGDINTRLVFIGNLLHEDSFLMRLKEKILAKEIDGHFLEIPLIKDGKISWPEKFPTFEDIKKLERKISDKVAWEREYMLRIISTAERVVHPEWIKHYDDLPKTENSKDFRFACLAVDLAVAKTEKSDYTAIVSAYVFGYEDKLKIYILPNPVNRKMTHDENLTAIMDTYVAIGGPERNGRIYVEDVGYQKSVIQELIRFNFPAKEVKVHGADKRARLMTVSHLVQNGTVLFPKHGCEALISQMVNFGCEKHDDLVDAFSILLTKIISRSHKRKRVGFSSLNIETGEWTECLVEVNDNGDD